MSTFTVILDSCVLYPSRLRSLLMRLAITGLYRARWTNLIHEEWMRNVLRDYPDVTLEQVARTRDLMDAYVLDSIVTGHESLIESLVLPDPDDRHVLAAAIVGHADAIVTFNLKDFPAGQLHPHHVEAIHPDAFLQAQFDLSADAVCAAVKDDRESLKKWPHDADQYLDKLERGGLPGFVALLRQHRDRL